MDSIRRYKKYTGTSAFGQALFSAISIIYLQHLGIDWPAIGALTAVFNIAVLLLELPSSYLADRWNAKITLQLGILTRVIGLVLFAFAQGKLALYGAEILTGVGFAFTSGTLGKLMIDEIGAQSRTELSQLSAAMQKIGMAANGVGVVAGVAIYSLQPRAVWLAAAVFVLLSGVFTLRMQQGQTAQESEAFSVLGGIGNALRSLPFWIAVIAGATAVSPIILWQTRFGDGSLYYLAFVAFMMGIVGAWAAHLSGKEWVLRLPVLLLIAANIVCIAMFAVAPWAPLQILGFLLHVMLQTALTIRIYGIFQYSLPGQLRATLTSLASLGDSAVVAVAGIGVTMLMASGGYLLASTVSFTLLVLLGILFVVGKETAMLREETDTLPEEASPASAESAEPNTGA